MDKKRMKSVIESLMFVYSDPISLYRFSTILETSQSEIRQCIHELMDEYKKDNRGFKIIEVNDKFRLGTIEENHDYIEEFCKNSPNRGLSNSALEVLAIVAYKQPVTRIEIEEIRGVRSASIIRNLVARDLIEKSGTLDTIGNPYLYKTTDTFLTSFGFKSLDQLPDIKDIHNFDLFANFNYQENDTGDDHV